MQLKFIARRKLAGVSLYLWFIICQLQNEKPKWMSGCCFFPLLYVLYGMMWNDIQVQRALQSNELCQGNPCNISRTLSCALRHEIYPSDNQPIRAWLIDSAEMGSRVYYMGDDWMIWSSCNPRRVYANGICSHLIDWYVHQMRTFPAVRGFLFWYVDWIPSCIWNTY